MTKIKVEALHDEALRPTTFIIKKAGRKLEVNIDYDAKGGMYGIRFDGARRLIPDIKDILDIIFPRAQSVTLKANQFYDIGRNPESKTNHTSFTENPSGSNIKLTYACPSDKIALVEVLQAQAVRITAPTTAGRTRSWWTYTPHRGTAKVILNAVFIGANIGDKASESIGHTITLQPRDKIEASAWDLSTAGTVYYHHGYKLTEFDV